MSTIKLLRHWLLPAIVICFAHGNALAKQVTVVLSEDAAAYAEVVDGIKSTLKQNASSKWQMEVVSLSSLQTDKTEALKNSSAIVTVGLRAAQAVAERGVKTPVLCTLIPRDSFEKLFKREAGDKPGDNVSAIYLEQTFSRQLALLRIALPDKKRVGVLLGPQSESVAAALTAEATASKLQTVIEKTHSPEDIYAGLKKILDDSDVMLAVPDAQIFNPSTAQNILLTTYRYQTPLMAFSQSYVKAGALLAVYTRPEQFGQQAAEMLLQLENSRTASLPAPTHPKYFTVGVNQQVARSLRLAIDDELVLHEKLRLRELNR